MALVKQILENAIKAAFDNVSDRQIEPAVARAQMAADVATAIDNYIKSATVTVATGIPVATAGSPTAQTGATTATGTGTIN